MALNVDKSVPKTVYQIKYIHNHYTAHFAPSTPKKSKVADNINKLMELENSQSKLVALPVKPSYMVYSKTPPLLGNKRGSKRKRLAILNFGMLQ